MTSLVPLAPQSVQYTCNSACTNEALGIGPGNKVWVTVLATFHCTILIYHIYSIYVLFFLLTNTTIHTCMHTHFVSLCLANVDVDHLKALGTAISAEECLSLCCDLGQERCQYLWVFKEACFSVGCDNNGIGCLPQLLPVGVKIDSIYVKMQYAAMETDLDDVEELLDNQLVDKSRNHGVDEKGHPPVADAGRNVTVQLPVDVVHLYGNRSKSDQVSQGCSLAQNIRCFILSLSLSLSTGHQVLPMAVDQ